MLVLRARRRNRDVRSKRNAFWRCFEVLPSDDIVDVPRKIRQLMADLEKNGFVNRGGKGSHRNFLHPSGVKITLSGGPGDDAKHYQERALKRAIQIAKS